MKFIAHFSRIFVGIIFIFSGLIKLNDPVGTEIKLEEYFDVFATDFPWMAGFWHFWVPLALYVSIFLCALELVLGVCLLVQYKLKTASWVLLATVIFFGFLTFYSAYFNKVTDCGCFGETIKLKPWTSFIKDMVLLFFILIILWQRHIFADKKTGSVVAISSVFCLLLGIYAVRYLPVQDGLPYAIGENIAENMKPSETPKFKYIMEKNGKEQEFNEYPTDTTWKFKQMIQLNEDEAKARITDYNLYRNGDSIDYKAESFVGKKLMIVSPFVQKAHTEHFDEIRSLIQSLKGSDVTVWLVTGSADSDVQTFVSEQKLAIPVLSADVKVLKTIARANPVIWLLKDGTVKGKWSHNATPSKEEVLEKLQ
jgi:uncharacterized membrane protein YphA (DoxX/SURF4 family)